MLCSDCSAPIKPVVALDIDGTLADYHAHLWRFMREYFGRELPAEWQGEPPDWEEYLGLSRSEYREVKLAFRQGGMKRTMPRFTGASGIAMRAHTAGAEVWITTTRPWLRLDSVDPDTREWLRRNDIYYDHLLYDDHKYPRLAELVNRDRVAFVLDDLADQVTEALAEFGSTTAYMILRQHNRKASKGVVLPDLLDAAEIMTQKIKNWRQRYGVPRIS